MPIPSPQGNLNLLAASVVLATLGDLTITSQFLAKEAISIALGGQASKLLPTLTGGVQSPEPYQIADVTVHLVKSMSLANLWKLQQELDTNLGSITVIPDASTLSPYPLENCVLLGVEPMTFDGNQAGYVIKIQGIYYTNAAMWAAA